MVKVGRGQTDKWNDTKRERKLGQGLVSWGRDTEEQKRGRRDREIVAHGKWDEFQPNTGWLRHACCRTDHDPISRGYFLSLSLSPFRARIISSLSITIRIPPLLCPSVSIPLNRERTWMYLLNWWNCYASFWFR